jgi:hypothetical protein
MMCGPSDYTGMSIVFDTRRRRMVNWCSSDRIFEFDYGGDQRSHGGKWIEVHRLAAKDRTQQTDSLAQAAYDSRRGLVVMLRPLNCSAYTLCEGGSTNPMLQWYDPATRTSGTFDRTKANHPRGFGVPRDLRTFAPDRTHRCYAVICEATFPSIVYDGVDESILVVGRHEGDGRLMLWRLSDPRGPNEKWEIIDGLVDAPVIAARHFPLALMAYIPEHDAFILTLRIGSGDGGASTRNAQQCGLDGAPDDCFKMFGLRLRREGTRPPGVDGLRKAAIRASAA